MKILITGAGGFVGQLLAERLLLASHEVILADIFAPPIPSKASQHSSLATSIAIDISSASSPSDILPSDLDAAYVFHGIMSAGSEADLDLGYRVNLHSTIRLLDAMRIARPGLRVIYASSTAIYGQPLPAEPDETTLPTPRSSYGAQKVMVEYVLDDYSRRGLLNGLVLRLPTISVRPGKPTQAASSWMSGIVREPLQGLESSCPCPDEFQAWMCSPRTLVENLLWALEMDLGKLGAGRRVVNLPGVTVSVQQMLNALEEVGGKKARDLVKREEGSREILEMLNSWPTHFNVSKALGLGFRADQDFRGAVRDFKDWLADPDR